MNANENRILPNNQVLTTQGIFTPDGRYMRAATVAEYIRSLGTNGVILISGQDFVVKFIGAKALVRNQRG